MNRALYSASSGTLAQQFNIDVIANNVANVNTAGFKKVRAEFQDLLSQSFRAAGVLTAQGTNVPVPLRVGLGTRVAATQRVFLPGSIQQTGNPLDLAVQGEGFLQILLPSGETGYTRDGSMKMDPNGTVVTSDGYPLQPNVNIPTDATEVVISQDGNVSVRQPGSSVLSQVGTIQLARFANNAGLESIGKNMYIETPGSGSAIQGQPGQGPFGGSFVQQGTLEMSNVAIVEELVNLITAQRAFEANSKVITAADQMMQIVNNAGG